MNPEVHARRRAAIVEAAAAEFATHGVDGTSTAAVCRRAGIGSGTLFHYFATKRELFHAVFADDLPRTARRCAEALAAPDPDTGLDLLTGHLIDELTDPLAPGLASAALLQANRDPEFARLLTALDAQLQEALTTLLARLAERPGRTLPLPAPSAARWIRNLIDAAHLTADAAERDITTAELRLILSWLTGRREMPPGESP
ncbi:TetR/AcrR family transcriptional regulator [Streptomyces catenulae]|uniref:TetR/AcrR family transcriptional regulator n=1 Tax=Streptomyces catenulae TaxID=66875 RepID=A0ABV2YYQ6_9ACTN|nr:TetR/AcrR family transcriptional regulator [Streptomyces catenulae]